MDIIASRAFWQPAFVSINTSVNRLLVPMLVGKVKESMGVVRKQTNEIISKHGTLKRASSKRIPVVNQKLFNIYIQYNHCIDASFDCRSRLFQLATRL